MKVNLGWPLGNHPLINGLLIKQRTARDKQQAFFKAHIVEQMRCAEPPDWTEETTRIFHETRAADRALRSATVGLAWELDQNKEYY